MTNWRENSGRKLPGGGATAAEGGQLRDYRKHIFNTQPII